MTFRKSDELAAVMKRLMIAIQTGDSDIARRLLVNRPDTLIIGNRGEWLHGLEAHEVLAAQLSATPTYERTFHSLEAYEEGSIGWAAAKSTVTTPSGGTIDTRTTAVFALIDGVWQVVQWHASTPSEGIDDLLGVDAPKTLSELVESLGSDIESSLVERLDTAEVALLISDIEDSTRLGVEFGDSLWSDVVSRHFDDVARATAAYGGEVVKTMGDGALVAFTSPEDATRGALAIQQAVAATENVGDYRVRIGVHIGIAVHNDDDYFGYAVNKTARLTAAAAGGETLVSQAVADALVDVPDIDVGPARLLDLKGLPGKHAVYSLSTS